MTSPQIRVIAICLFYRADKILVFEAFDAVTGTPYYRPLGGGVEFGESTQEALAREIREEIGQEITDVRLLGVIENRFVCDGSPGHEIVFVYNARFTDATVYEREEFFVMEGNLSVEKATWRSLDSFDGYHRLVPGELIPLIKNCIQPL